jgi:hypothetical protein
VLGKPEAHLKLLPFVKISYQEMARDWAVLAEQAEWGATRCWYAPAPDLAVVVTLPKQGL